MTVVVGGHRPFGLGPAIGGDDEAFEADRLLCAERRHPREAARRRRDSDADRRAPEAVWTRPTQSRFRRASRARGCGRGSEGGARAPDSRKKGVRLKRVASRLSLPAEKRREMPAVLPGRRPGVTDFLTQGTRHHVPVQHAIQPSPPRGGVMWAPDGHVSWLEAALTRLPGTLWVPVALPSRRSGRTSRTSHSGGAPQASGHVVPFVGPTGHEFMHVKHVHNREWRLVRLEPLPRRTCTGFRKPPRPNLSCPEDAQDAPTGQLPAATVGVRTVRPPGGRVRVPGCLARVRVACRRSSRSSRRARGRASRS